MWQWFIPYFSPESCVLWCLCLVWTEVSGGKATCMVKTLLSRTWWLWAAGHSKTRAQLSWVIFRPLKSLHGLYLFRTRHLWWPCDIFGDGLTSRQSNLHNLKAKGIIRQHLKLRDFPVLLNLLAWWFPQCVWKLPWFIMFFCSVTIKTLASCYHIEAWYLGQAECVFLGHHHSHLALK